MSIQKQPVLLSKVLRPSQNLAHSVQNMKENSFAALKNGSFENKNLRKVIATILH